MELSSFDALSAFSKMPEQNVATVLLAGVEGVGKHVLAKAMVACHTSFSLNIHTTANFPLPRENEDARPKVDYICFIIDLTNKESDVMVQRSLKHIDITYLLGKCCIVVTKANDRRNNIIETILESYNLPALFGNLETETECHNLAKQILHSVEIAAGLKPNVTPLLLEATAGMHIRSYDL